MDAQTIVDTVAALDETTAISILTAILQSRPELAPAVVNYAVPDLTYPPSKALNERRSRGVVKSFNAEKGFGFIVCEELSAVFGSDVFVHGKQMGEFMPGAAVSFAVLLNKDNRPQGYDLQHDTGNKGWGKGKGPDGKSISSEGWGEHSPGFNASAMMQMMSQAWGGKMSGGKGKQMGGCGPSNRGPLKVDESSILGTFMGTIKSFNPKSGYGFINCPDLKAAGYEKDVFLNHQQLGEFEVGASVTFTCFMNDKGSPQAKDLADPLGNEPKKAKTGGDDWSSGGFGGGGASW